MLPKENEGVDVGAVFCVAAGVPNENALHETVELQCVFSRPYKRRTSLRFTRLSSRILLVLLTKPAERERHTCAFNLLVCSRAAFHLSQLALASVDEEGKAHSFYVGKYMKTVSEHQ